MFELISVTTLVIYVALGLRKPGIAIVTCPVICGVLFFSATMRPDPLYAAFGPLIFFITVVMVSISKREPDAGEWPQAFARWILIGIVVVLVLAIAFVLAASSVVGVFLSVVFVVSLLGFIVCAIIFAVTSRHSVAAYVLSTIGASIRQNLPLPMALETAAAGRTDKRSRILRSIQQWLVQGYDLSEALRRGYPGCPSQAMAMVAAADRMNQLPRAFASIEMDMIARTELKRKIRPVHPAYPCIILVTITFMLLGLAKFVFPMTMAVMHEFAGGAIMPRQTQILFAVTEWLFVGSGTILLILLVAAMLIGTGMWIHTRLRPRCPQSPYLISRIGDFVKWYTPVLGWFERNYSTVQVVEVLRLSLNSGATVNDAIAGTLELDVNGRFRRRLRRWLTEVESGQDIAESARRNGLGSAVAWAFEKKLNQGNTPAILETLESFYRSNYSYRANLIRFIVWPCMTICMGLLVGFVVYAIFSPSVALVHHLAEIAIP